MQHKRVMFCVLGLTLLLTISGAESRPGADEQSSIRAIVTDFETAWAKCDAKALSGLWTDDGDFQSPYGSLAKGRAEVEKFYSSALSAGYCQSKATGTIDNIRFVRNDVAVVDGTWGIQGARDQNGKAQAEEKGRFTAVAKKQGSKWLIVAQREMIPANAQ